jgi:hypothetical protein
MIEAYNFLGSWQLFPEKGEYAWGERPRSGIYRLEATEQKKEISIHHSWTTLAGEGFASSYRIIADGERQPFSDPALADGAEARFADALTLELRFFRNSQETLHILHELQPNGYLKLTQRGRTPEGSDYTNVEFFHKQMSVLPYSASVSGAIIKPTEEGVIRHKALTAMEEQTNMQLEQIRKQVELLALQAQEIHKRKELSMMIYGAKLSFKPEIGQVYHLYEKEDGQHLMSMISPKEWGHALPYKRFVASVMLLADHTWKEL